MVFLKLNQFSDFVFSLYKIAVEFLSAPDFETLAFFLSLPMLQVHFIFERQSNKRTANFLISNLLQCFSSAFLNLG